MVGTYTHVGFKINMVNNNNYVLDRHIPIKRVLIITKELVLDW